MMAAKSNNLLIDDVVSCSLQSLPENIMNLQTQSSHSRDDLLRIHRRADFTSEHDSLTIKSNIESAASKTKHLSARAKAFSIDALLEKNHSSTKCTIPLTAQVSL